LHGLLKLPEGLLQLGGIDLLNHLLEFLIRLERVVADEVVFLHLPGNRLHSLTQRLHAFFEGFLLLLKLLELALILPVALLFAAQCVPEFLELIPDGLRLIQEALHFVLRFVLMLFDLLVLLR
jgi:hypothetical protein